MQFGISDFSRMIVGKNNGVSNISEFPADNNVLLCCKRHELIMRPAKRRLCSNYL